MPKSLSPNAEQTEAWNESIGKAWIANVDALDRQIAPIGEAAFAQAAVKTGDSVLDIGCGAGRTTIELGRRVGESGWTHGVDISGLMIAAAGAALRQHSHLNVSFEIADAQTFKFRQAAYDVVYSRFGVMFFQDPRAAFINIRSALKPQGRLAFCCWRGIDENPLMNLPLQAAAALLPPENTSPIDPEKPGPFAFANPDKVRDILSFAGFTNISIEKWDGPLGPNPFGVALQVATELGPLGRRLLDMEPDQPLRERVKDAVRDALLTFVNKDGEMCAPGAAWIVSAR